MHSRLPNSLHSIEGSANIIRIAMASNITLDPWIWDFRRTNMVLRGVEEHCLILMSNYPDLGAKLDYLGGLTPRQSE